MDTVLGLLCPCLVQSREKRLKNNSFEILKNRLSGGYSTQEGRCEMIGYKYCEKIDAGELTLENAIGDIIEFSQIYSETTDGVQLAWLSLHLGLGLLYQYKVYNKVIFRKLLTEMLLHSMGIDIGLFLRDLFNEEDLNANNEAINKSKYVMHFCAGMKIDLSTSELRDKLFSGPSRVVYADLLKQPTCYYFDLPTGHPTLTMSSKPVATAEFVGKTPLLMACENLKPEVVLCLLQYGASPSGKPIEYLLNVLCAHKLITGKTDETFGDQPIEIVQKALRYCFRALPRLYVSFCGQTVADLQIKNKEIYYLKKQVVSYLPDDRYKTPAALKHLSRCIVRNILLEADNIPAGVEKLPKMTPDLVKYLQLNA